MHPLEKKHWAHDCVDNLLRMPDPEDIGGYMYAWLIISFDNPVDNLIAACFGARVAPLPGTTSSCRLDRWWTMQHCRSTVVPFAILPSPAS